jgi:chromosome segregation ATPase
LKIYLFIILKIYLFTYLFILMLLIMKTLKKYVSLLTIAVGLMLTSCVKDTESDSVTKLRDSKAQLNAAQAALSAAQADAAKLAAEAAKIQAEAEKLRAEGEKALATAQAEYYAAQTAQLQAQTAAEIALAAVNLDKAKEELERLKQQVLLQTAQTEQQIQRLKEEMAEAALKHEAQMELLQAQLKIAKSQADQTVIAQLNSLISQYSNALYNIQSLKNNINSYTLNIARYESYLAIAMIDSVRFVKNFEVEQKATIRSQTAYKEDLTESLNQWKAAIQAPGVGPLITAKKAELKALQDGLRDVKFAVNAANEIRSEKLAVYDSALTDLNDYNYLLSSLSNGGSTWAYTGYSWIAGGYDTLYTDSYGKEFNAKPIPKDDEYHLVGFSNYYYNSYSDATGEIYARCRYGVYYEFYYKYRASYSYSGAEAVQKDALARELSRLKQDSIRYKEGYDKYSAELNVVLPKLNAASAAEIAALAAQEQKYEAYITAYEASETARHAFEKARIDFYAKAAPQSKADTVLVNNAKVAYDGTKYWPSASGNAPDPTGGKSGAYNKAVEAYNAAYDAYRLASAVLEGVKTDIYTAVNNVSTAEYWLNQRTNQLEAFYPNANFVLNNSRAALQAKLNAAQEAYDLAQEEYLVLNDEYYTTLNITIPNLNNEIYQLELYYDANGAAATAEYVQGRIDYYTTQINYAQQYIDEANAKLQDISNTSNYLNSVGSTITSYKNTIASYKVQIEQYKGELTGLEVIAATLKAAIDSLMP